MNGETLVQKRYGLIPFLLIGVFFIVASPAYWKQVELRQSTVAESRENSYLYEFVYPAYAYGFGRMTRGETPLWSAGQLCGTPFYTDPRIGLYQPLHAVFRFFRTEKALAIHAFVCYSLMGLFYAGFARAMGIRYPAAFIGAVSYAFCGASVAAKTDPALSSVLVWVPLAFWAGAEYTWRFRYAAAVFLGLVSGCMMLSGPYSVSLLALALLATFVAAGSLFPRAPMRPDLTLRMGGLLIAAAIALATGLAQALPAFLWARDLHDATPVLWAIQAAGQAPSSAADLLLKAFMVEPGIVPRFVYVGIAIVLFIPAALFRRTNRVRTLLFFVAALACFTLYLFAPNDLLPRLPRRAYLFPGVFCVITLAVLGADRLLEPRRGHRSPSIWAPALAVTALSVVLLAASAGPVRVLIGIILIILLPFLAVRASWLGGVCGILLAVLLFLELGYANSNAHRHPYQDAPGCYEPSAQAVDSARKHLAADRVFVSSGVMNYSLPRNLGLLYPMDAVNGSRLPLSRAQAQWWEAMAGGEAVAEAELTSQAPCPRLMNYMAARIILADQRAPLYEGSWTEPGPRLREIDERNGIRVYANGEAVARVSWYPSWRSVRSLSEAIDLLSDESFDARRECVIENGPESPPAGAIEASGEIGMSSIEAVTPERVVIRINAPGPGAVVLADTYAPGWSARLNGTPCPILRANGLFRGVLVPEGEHTVVFSYGPFSFFAGLGGSLLCLLALALAGVGAFLRPR